MWLHTVAKIIWNTISMLANKGLRQYKQYKCVLPTSQFGRVSQWNLFYSSTNATRFRTVLNITLCTKTSHILGNLQQSVSTKLSKAYRVISGSCGAKKWNTVADFQYFSPSLILPISRTRELKWCIMRWCVTVMVDSVLASVLPVICNGHPN